MVDSRVGFIWIYALVVMFATHVIELVIRPVLKSKYLPVLINNANDTLPPAKAAEIVSHMQNIFTVMHYFVYFLIFGLLVYMLLSLFLKEKEQYYV